MKYTFRLRDFDQNNYDTVGGFKTLEEALDYATTEDGWLGEFVMVERLMKGDSQWRTLGTAYELDWQQELEEEA